MKQSGNSKSRQARGLAAIGLTAGMVALFATLGGAGMAQNSGTAAEGQYGKKVTLCHKGKKTITVGKAAVPAHLRHGDTVGTCAAAKAKKAEGREAQGGQGEGCQGEGRQGQGCQGQGCQGREVEGREGDARGCEGQG